MKTWDNIAKIAHEVNDAKLSAVDLVSESLSLINMAKEFDAIISLTEDRALERAKLIDEGVKSGKNMGRLAGVPFIAKDNFLTYGGETTAASNILKGFNAPFQASAIEKLEAEGAIVVAKANLDAFAHGASTENSDFMTTKNPHDKTRVPGGSSGGSAASVVLGLAPFSIGTDTGGSIRQPAAFSGCVGLKPTYGLVSRSGVVAMASSTDCIGPLTRTVGEASLILDVMSGRDPLDSTTIEKDSLSYIDLDSSLEGKKIGLVKEYFDDSLNSDIKDSIDELIAKLKTAGAEIVDVSLPILPSALAVYYILCPAEVSSNLSRYDGQRFGYTYDKAKDLNESYAESRARGFGKEAKRRIIIGTYVLSSGYYDAYYKKAQLVRTKIVNDFEKAFKSVDFLLGPVAPTQAFKIGEKSNDPLAMYLSDVLTVAPNLAGIPAITIPIGMKNDLPVAVQLMAAQKQDRSLLGAARKVEELVK
ncbi:MAG: Asp-tRNA(Asn)/Glu-tRNA(Gln) amidotransferase subunit GatA [Candidatus Saccharibacteria bacterium]